AQRCACDSWLILSVVERGVKNDDIKLFIHKRKTRHFSSKAGEKRPVLLLEMNGCTQSIPIIHQQVDCYGRVSLKPKPMTHPAISSTKIEDFQRIFSVVLGQQIF